MKTVYSKIIPRWVSFRLNCRYIRKSGIVTTTAGSILVLRMKNNRSSFPPISKRLKAYAAKVPKTTDKIVETPAIIKEFFNLKT